MGPRKLQRRAAIVARDAGNAALARMRQMLWRGPRPLAARRVCIYRIGNIGDTACAIPAAHAIRNAYPDARITLVTSPGRRGAIGARELLAQASWIDEVVVYHREEMRDLRAMFRFINELRARRFDLWIELPVVAASWAALARNMIFAKLVGARWGGGWRFDGASVGAQAQSELIEFPNEVQRLAQVLAGIGIDMGSPRFALGLDESSSKRANAMLARAGLLTTSVVAIMPGARLETNRWPEGGFIEVGRHLSARGFGVVVLGGPSDGERGDRIAAGIGEHAVNFAGRTSLLDTCQILSQCRMLVSNDTGAHHLAAAVNTPSVVIFSSRDFRGKWHPYGDNHIVLRKWIECHTCLLEACPVGNRCMSLIKASEVIAACDKLFELTNSTDSKARAAA